MRRINLLAVTAAAVAAFVISSVYYSPLALGEVLRAIDRGSAVEATASTGKIAAELVRTLVISYVLARFVVLGGGGRTGAVRQALSLWLGFSAMMWVGAILWENTPWQLAAIHGGDWLIKLLIIAAIVGAWPPRRSVTASLR